MVTYIKDTTDYGIYLIESETATNDNWITAHAGDPGEADIALFTDGSEYIRIDKVDQNQDALTFGMVMEPITDAVTETVLTGEIIANSYTIRGTLYGTGATSALALADLYAKGEKVKKFCDTHNRIAAKQAYLVNRYGVTYYEKFYDETLTELKYARGYVFSRVITYNEGELILNVVIVWRIAWT